MERGSSLEAMSMDLKTKIGISINLIEKKVLKSHQNLKNSIKLSKRCYQKIKTSMVGVSRTSLLMKEKEISGKEENCITEGKRCVFIKNKRI